MALKAATAKAGSKIAPKASNSSPEGKAATKAASAPAVKGNVGTALKPQAAVVVTTKHLAASIADQQELPQKQEATRFNDPPRRPLPLFMAFPYS